MPFVTLGTLNLVIILGLALLAAMTVGHLYYNFRFSRREERGVLALFGLFASLSTVDRGIASRITDLATANTALGAWAVLAVVVRAVFLGVVWGFALIVLWRVWRPRMLRRFRSHGPQEQDKNAE